MARNIYIHFRVESALELNNSRESADQATMYTA